MMKETRIKRIVKDLDDVIVEEYRNNPFMGKWAAQIRIANIWREANKNFAIPKGVLEIDLTKCHLKKRKR